MFSLLLQSNGGPNSIGNVERPGGHAHNPNGGGQSGAGPGGSNAMPATVSAPPPPEFEMKGNDFPALPGMSIMIIVVKCKNNNDGSESNETSICSTIHILGAREAGSSRRLAEAQNQQSASQTGSSSSASSGSAAVGETGSGESGPHRPKGNAPSGSAAGNAGGPQTNLTGSGAAEAKGAAHDATGSGSAGPPDSASPWENKG